MKLKRSELPKETPLKIGDTVFTSISHRPGEIVKIEEKRGEYRFYIGCEEWRELTVKLPMPMIERACFRDVLFICQESEVTRHPLHRANHQ